MFRFVVPFQAFERLLKRTPVCRPEGVAEWKGVPRRVGRWWKIPCPFVRVDGGGGRTKVCSGAFSRRAKGVSERRAPGPAAPGGGVYAPSHGRTSATALVLSKARGVAKTRVKIVRGSCTRDSAGARGEGVTHAARNRKHP